MSKGNIRIQRGIWGNGGEANLVFYGSTAFIAKSHDDAKEFAAKFRDILLSHTRQDYEIAITVEDGRGTAQ
jgi:hypothetical protein